MFFLAPVISHHWCQKPNNSLGNMVCINKVKCEREMLPFRLLGTTRRGQRWPENDIRHSSSNSNRRIFHVSCLSLEKKREERLKKRQRKFHTWCQGWGSLCDSQMHGWSDRSLTLAQSNGSSNKKTTTCELRYFATVAADAGFNELNKVSLWILTQHLLTLLPLKRTDPGFSNGYFLHRDSIAGVVYGQNIFRDH